MPDAAVTGLPMTSQGERKFLLDLPTAMAIWPRAAALLIPQPRDPARPITYHRTTYFDTLAGDYFWGRRAVERRVRVREYATACASGGALELADTCFLEIKESAHGLRAKSRLEVEVDEVDWRLVEFAGAGLVPCLTTWYQRVALTDAARDIRVTLDSDIRYCPPQPIGGPCRSPPAAFASAGSLILEIKAWNPLPAWLRALVHTLEEATDFSKFRDGMEACQRITLPQLSGRTGTAPTRD
jgi:hypothetical protein